MALIETADCGVNSSGNYSDVTQYQDGVLLTEAGNVSTALHGDDLLDARNFSLLSNDEDLRSFATRHGFLSGVNQLDLIRVEGKEFIYEPIREWRFSIREVAFVFALIDLCFKSDGKRVEELMGGAYGPHRIAYMGQWFSDSFELELMTPQAFFKLPSPNEVVDQNGVRTSSGVVSIGKARGVSTDQALLSKFHGIGHVFQYISDVISRALTNIEFGTLSPSADFARFTSAGLRTAMWLQVWENLKSRGAVGRCNWCDEHFVINRQGHESCSPACARRFRRASKK